MYQNPLTNPELEQIARRRAGAKLGWFIHATVYVLVNILLAGLSLHQGRHWAIYPALGWGIGLLAHGLAVWVRSPAEGWYQHLLRREREAIDQHQPPKF